MLPGGDRLLALLSRSQNECARRGRGKWSRRAITRRCVRSGALRICRCRGTVSGVSVDLWRRVAEDLHLNYRLNSVPEMGDVLAGLENGRFDVAIGAITITPER